MFRKVLPAADSEAMQADFRADIAAGKLVMAPCALADILAEANGVSAARTPTGGHRAFDVLHVAAALCLGAGEFLSFDANQRALAAAERLTVSP